jgi:uncharacterized protein involved in exopolysaccharide biosynthesis
LLFEPGELRDYAGFAVRSLGRRWKLVGTVLLLFAAAVAAAIHSLPRRYHVEARLLAMPADGAPGAARQNNGETTGLQQSAAEVVVSRRTLLELVRDNDLIESWDRTRGPLLRIWDNLGRQTVDPASRERSMIRSLERKLTVQVKGAEVTIAFDWSDAQVAVDVVRSVEKKLVAARRQAEIVPLERRVSSLEASASSAQHRIDALAARIEEAIKAKRRGARASTVRGLQAEGRYRDLPDPALSQKRIQLVAQRRAIAELEDVRRRRLTELSGALAEQKATLGPGNPALLETREKIRAVEADGAQLAALKAREQELFAAYVREGGREIELSTDAPWPADLRDDDPAIALDRARISMEQSNLTHLLDQVAEAHVALATARSGFDSRYVELLPAEVPEQPAFPNLLLLVLAGLLGGAMVAFFGAVAADLSGGVIRESWQARRELDVPLLAEVPEP